MRYACQLPNGGSAPATPGFNAVAPEWHYGAAGAAPAIPAAESTLGSHPCVALSSAQVLPEWTPSTSPCNDFSSNGDYPLNFVSHSRGSLQRSVPAFPRKQTGEKSGTRASRADQGVRPTNDAVLARCEKPFSGIVVIPCSAARSTSACRSAARRPETPRGW